MTPGARSLQQVKGISVEVVRAVVCGDCRLTFRMIVSLLDIKETVFGRLSPKIWVCLKSNGTEWTQ